MLVVQNRLIAPTGLGQRIEQGFTHSTTNMKELHGFVSFKLMRAEGQPAGVEEGEILYIAQTIWQDRESYENWRSGDAFARAHSGPNSGPNSPLKSSLEIFEVVLETL
jgi:heme-degrading monooxygenase HmoA